MGLSVVSFLTPGIQNPGPGPSTVCGVRHLIVVPTAVTLPRIKTLGTEGLPILGSHYFPVWADYHSQIISRVIYCFEKYPDLHIKLQSQI